MDTAELSPREAEAAALGRWPRRRGARRGSRRAAVAQTLGGALVCISLLCGVLGGSHGGTFVVLPFGARASPRAPVCRGQCRGPAPSRQHSAVSRAALQLIGSQGSRSPLVNWYLEEIGQAYENIDASRVDRTSPDFASPFGQIPALYDGDVALFESGAILIYLAQKYGGYDTPEKLTEVSKWIVWANAALDPLCFKENDRGQVEDTGLRKDSKLMSTLEKIFSDGRENLLGTDFTVADVAVASYLLYTVDFFPDAPIGKWPNVARWCTNCALRPAFSTAFGGNKAETLATRCTEPPKDQGGAFDLFRMV